MRQLRGFIAVAVGFPAAALAGLLWSSPGRADTLDWALAQAYQNNPSLNAQRAALRATDENVPQALSGYRPKVSVTANAGYNYNNETSTTLGQSSAFAETFVSRGYGANASYTLFNGYQTANHVRQAESQVDAARETLRVTEQQVLLDAATAYMNLLRDKAILDLNRSNVEVLTEQLMQTRRRYKDGELTPTDVAQSASRLAAARSTLLGAQSNFTTSQANYRRVIGVEAGRLAPGTPVDRFSPNDLTQAITQGQAQSPSVLAAAYGADVAELTVRISEGALYPSLIPHWILLAGLGPRLRDGPRNRCLGRWHLVGADLPGRRRIFDHPSIEGDARSATAQYRCQPRSGARHGGAELGATQCRQGGD
jgi:outer membrane protein